MNTENGSCSTVLPKLGRINCSGEEIQILDQLQPQPPNYSKQRDCETSTRHHSYQLYLEGPAPPVNQKKYKIKMPSNKLFPKDFFSFCCNNPSSRVSICGPSFIEKKNKFTLSQSTLFPLSSPLPSESSGHKYVSSQRQSFSEKLIEKHSHKSNCLFQQLARMLHRGRVLTKVKTIELDERKNKNYLSTYNQLQSKSLSCCGSTESLENPNQKYEALSKTLLECETSPASLPVVRRCKLPKMPFQTQLRNGSTLSNIYRFRKSAGVNSTVDVSPQTNMKFSGVKVAFPLKLTNLSSACKDNLSANPKIHSEEISLQRSIKKLISPSSESVKFAQPYAHLSCEEENPNNLTFGKCDEVQYYIYYYQF